MRPPRRPRFFRKCIFCWARVVGSDSSQNRCPAYVVGTMEPIRASAASRRYFPTARRTPAADLHGAVDTDKRLRVEVVDPNAFTEGLTHGLCLLGLSFRIPEGVPSTDNEDGCE